MSLLLAVNVTVLVQSLGAFQDEGPALSIPEYRSRINTKPGQSAADLRRFAAQNEMAAGFNAIGGRAIRLRRAMTPQEAQLFDAVLLDVMGALLTIPGLGLPDSHEPAKIVPERPRHDRISQLSPDLQGLERFFARLAKASSTASERKLFTAAQKGARKMLAALPDVLPTVAANAPPH